MSTGTLSTTEIRVARGPGLLSGIGGGPSLVAHRAFHGTPGRARLEGVLSDLERVDLRGRGGAGFPFARKLATTAKARGRASVVVNVSEGEPPSAKDAALAMTTPHLVLDGAVIAADVLGAREVHLVVPDCDRPVRDAMAAAVAERVGDRVRWVVHRADDVFVAGQAAAIVELMEGRPNRPVTTWEPAAVRGYRGRPTLLSNAETFAQLGLLALHGPEAYVGRGSSDEPGTTLLTVHDSGGRRVVEVELGTPWRDVLAPEDLARPALLGGYHGTWATAGELRALAVSRRGLAAAGLTLGAGVVLVPDGCPLAFAGTVASYLATQSARRCGPCLNGLPALATALERVVAGVGGVAETARLCGLVERRGACAHPDGTARMIRSALRRFPEEVDRHARGGCSHSRHEARRTR